MRTFLLVAVAIVGFIVNASTGAVNQNETSAENDSVSVVAYFCKNDTLEYIYTYEDTKIKGTDTTTNLVASSKFRLVVLDSTATGYRIQYTPLEIDDAQYKPNGIDENAGTKEVFMSKIVDLINKNTSNTPIVFTTNEMGQIEHIENWKSVSNNIVNTVSSVIDEVCKSIPQSSDYIDRESIINLVKLKYSTEEQLIENYNDGFSQLFTFHGLVFSEGGTTVEDEGEDGGMPSIIQIVAYNLDPNDEDRDDFDPDYQVAMQSISILEGEAVKELVGSVLGVFMKQNDITESVTKSLNDTKDFDNATMSITDGYECYYWVNGWPSETIHYNYIEITAPDQPSQARIKTKSLECVYRSCFNFMR